MTVGGTGPAPDWQADVIATARLRLRPPAVADVASLFEAIDDVAIVRMLARVPWPYERDDAAAWVAAAQADHVARRGFHRVVEDAAGLCGVLSLSFSPVSLFEPAPELGYWIARNRWGRGYASEAGRSFLAFAFGSLGVKAVRSGAFHDNPASLRVQARLGFEVVGQSGVFCLARGAKVAHIDTMLTRARLEEIGPQPA